MKLEFVCLQNSDLKMKMIDYQPPEEAETVIYPVKINKNQLVMMQMTSVDDDDSLGDDLEMMTPCFGSLETEILPLLTSSVSVTSPTEACVMFYIDKIGQQVMYR